MTKLPGWAQLAVGLMVFLGGFSVGVMSCVLSLNASTRGAW